MSRTDESGLPAGADNSPAFLLHKEGFTIQNYRLIARIGEGSFGEVWKAERGGFHVALKILKTSMTSDETQRELKSLETLRRLHHKYLLHTENFWSDGDRLFIEMELAEGGTLKERLKAYQATGKAGIPEDEVLKYFTEMAKALDYLHGHRPVFLHRDIKPANVLLVAGCAKLADFGLLRQVASDNSSTKTQGGTFPYMAPESIASDVFSIYTDLFAFAVTYAELRQGELPFPGKNQYQICDKILREAPSLTDIFHPDEKKVLLKALEKDPRQRFTSCGEFVFELNRAVPWVPAVDVPVLASPPPAAEWSGSNKGTDPAQPNLTDPGTLRKKTPATMQDINEPAAGQNTTLAADGTALHDRNRKSGQPAPTSASVQKPAVQEAARPGAAPKPALAQPRPKLPARALVSVALAALAIAAMTGVWFLANRSAQGEVRDLIARNKFPEALQAIKDANRLVLPSGDALQKEVEEKWWAELKEPAPDASPDALKPVLRDLDKFKNAFASHDGAKTRHAKVQGALSDAVAREVNGSLLAKKIDAARDLVKEYEEFLPERGKSLYARIDTKQKVVTVLKLASDKLDRNEFEACLALIQTAAIADKDDFESKKQIGNLAETGRADRDEKHKKRLAALEELLTAKQTKKLEAELAAMIQFRRDYPKADWPDLGKYRPESDRDLSKLLAQFEQVVRFEDLDRLAALTDDEPGRKASSPLFAQALERLVKKDNYVWLPVKEERDKCIIWCEQRIGSRSACLLAFQAECLIEAGAALEQINKIELPPATDWYGAYVQALVKTKNQKHAEAADILAENVKDKANTLNPRERSKNAAQTLRSAVAELKRTGKEAKEFAEQKDAVKAAAWLTSMLALEEAKRDDLVNLAFASLKVELKEADKLFERVEQRLSQSDKSTGYAWLGKAYRADLEQASADVAKGQWDQAKARRMRAQSFAQRWRSMALEDAADLNVKAVDLEVRAAFAKTQSGEEMYRAFETALKKADEKPADGFFVPVVVAKLEFAGTRECGAIHFKKTIEEGEAALALAATAEKSSKSMKDWWGKLRCKGMVKLADLHLRAIREATEKPDKATLTQEFERALERYEEARRIAKYTEKFNGELAGKIGVVHLVLGNFEKAKGEFADCLTRLDMVPPQPYSPEIQREVDETREFLRARVKELEKSQ